MGRLPRWGIGWLILAGACSTQVAPLPEIPLTTDISPVDLADPADLDGPMGTIDSLADSTLGDPTASETGVPDGNEVSTPPDATGDEAPETFFEDASSDDPALDAGSDAPVADLAPDACEPVSCGLWCEFGFAIDERGCPVCACRDCLEDRHCEGRLPGCPRAFCSTEGACRCDCSSYSPPRYACPDRTPIPYCSCSSDGVVCEENPEWRCPTLCKPGSIDPLPCPDGSSLDWCVCRQDLSCRPVCRPFEEGSATGWWENPCTHQMLRTDPPCTPGRPPLCTAIGTRSEGWRDEAGLVAFARCGPVRECVPWSSETCVGARCSLEDTPGLYRCPDGHRLPFCRCEVPGSECVPECRLDPSRNQAWFDPCSGQILAKQICLGCTPSCREIGSKSEGWYSSCGPSLIAYAPCGTGTWTCAPEAPWEACSPP